MGNPLIPLMGQNFQPRSQLSNLLEATQQQGAAQQQQLQAQAAPGQLAAQDIANTEGQQRVQMNAQQIAAQKAVQDAYRAALKVGDDGTPTVDRTQMQAVLAQEGHGDQIPSIMKGFNDMDEATAKLSTAKAAAATAENDYIGAFGNAVKESKYDPNVIATGLAHATQAGYGQHAQQLQQEMQQNPDKIPQIIDSLIAQSQKQQELGNSKETADARATAAAKPTEASLAVAAAAGDPKATAALGVLSDQKGQVTPAVKYQQAQENYRATLGRAATNSNEVQKQGIAALQKQGDTYSQFVNTSESLKNSLEAAKNGNEMAAAVAPLQGTLFVTTAEGVKRINGTELANVTGAGSLIQRINGELGKQTGTGPLSQKLKDDLSQLVDVYSKTKYDNYQKQATYTQKLHGLDPSKTPVLAKDGSIAGENAAPSRPAAATHTGVGSVDGKKHYLDSNNKDLGLAE